MDFLGCDQESLGWKLKDKGDYKGAIKAFNKAIEGNHYKKYFAYHGKGECLLELENYEAALNCFMSAIKINPKHNWAYHGAGRAYYHLGQYNIAIGYFDTSLRLNPYGILANHWKGKTLLKMHEYEKAEETLKKAISNATYAGDKYLKNIPSIEADLRSVQEEIERNKQSEPKSQIIIQGDNHAPINNRGIIASDDAIINRPEIDNSVTDKKIDCNEAKQDIIESQAANHKKIGIHEVKKDKIKILEVEQGYLSKVLGKKKLICSNCGAEVKEGQRFCNNCGGELE